MDSIMRRTRLYRIPLFIALLFVAASAPMNGTTSEGTEPTGAETQVAAEASDWSWKAYERPWGWLCEGPCTPGWCCFWIGGDEA